MKKYLKKKSVVVMTLALIVGLTLYFSSSDSAQEPAYPSLLVDADSAIMRGKYKECDSLLTRFDKTCEIADETTAKYRQLLRITRKFNAEEIVLKDLVVIDSLCNYYRDFGSRDKYIRALLFRHEVEKLVGDYPNALKTCLAAKDQLKDAPEASNTVWGWVMQNIGNIYFTQKMYDDCKGYYRKFYNLALQRHDTLRTAYGAYLMAVVYTIESEVDSICEYYEKSIALSEGIEAANTVKALASHGLCDIYIQTEQFDKALAIMPRNEQNFDNWAYWHYGQQHSDSAIHYFRLLVGKYGPASDAEYLRILTQLEQERGNTTQALADYQALLAAEDSAQAQSQAEATRQTAARHEYEAIVAERNAMAARNSRLARMVGMGLLIVAIVAVAVGATWWIRRKRSRKAVEPQMVEPQTVAEEPAAEELVAEVPTGENVGRQADQQPNNTEEETERLQQLQAELEASAVYRRLMNPAPGAKRQLTDEEWLWMGEQLDALHHDMGRSLGQRARLSATELRLCYLTRLGLTSTEMADVLCKSISAVSHARSRLSKKIMGDEAEMDDLTALIMRY